MQKILIVTGTRPEAIKLLPVYLEFKKNMAWNTLLVSTGQHQQMLWSIFDFFNVKPDFDMQVMTNNQSLENLTSQILRKCSGLFQNEKPDLVIVQGDTTTAMAAALSAFYHHIPVAHIEAGLRSYDVFAPFPEEVNRRIISLVTALHFAPTTRAALAIRKEKVAGKIYKVGNTVIDSLLFGMRKVKLFMQDFEQHYASILIGFEKMVLITGHRRENFGEGFVNICDAIEALAASYPSIAWVYPVHLNPNVKDIVFNRLQALENVRLIEPVPYDHMIFLMMKCYLILTDSGGIQEEAPTLGKPVIVMRNKTERPEGIVAGCCILAGNSKNKIIRAVKRILNDKAQYQKMTRATNPYGKGDSAKRIFLVVKKNLEEIKLSKR